MSRFKVIWRHVSLNTIEEEDYVVEEEWDLLI